MDSAVIQGDFIYMKHAQLHKTEELVMNYTQRFLLTLTASIIMLSMCATVSQAALKAVGPTDQITTLPSYYLDNNNLALMPCVDQNGFCILPPPFDPALPPFPTPPITTVGPVTDLNFPGESFYYSAEAQMPIDGDIARLTFVMEAAFLAGVAPDSGIVFLRTDLVKMQGLTPNSTYRVTHPYGTFDFTTDGAGVTTGGGGVAVRLEDNAGVPAQWLPAGMKAGTITGIGPFLTRKITPPETTPFIVAANGHTYIGDAATPVEVVGSLTGNNFFRIERILTNGAAVTGVSWQTNLFVLMGRVFTGPIASDLTIRATYARNANNAQVDIFATALPGAVLSISGSGFTTTNLNPEIPAASNHFLHIPLGTSTLPTGVVLTNSLDLNGATHPVTLADEVIITSAVYNPNNQKISIVAVSRDTLAPLPTLTAVNLPLPNTLDATGKLIKTLTSIPPANITVTSSRGGSNTIPLSVVELEVPPLAVNDSASSYGTQPITIHLFANDVSYSAAGLDPNSIIFTTPFVGSLISNGSDGVVYFPPDPAVSTTTLVSFSYQVKDIGGTLSSNIATVAIAVNPSALPPVAGNDNVTTQKNTTVTNFNLLANDTAATNPIVASSLTIVSPPASGSLINNGTGTVSFTPAFDFTGVVTFSYSVQDTQNLTSNTATVTITVNAPPAAQNDAASTNQNTPVTVNLTANDSDSDGSLNPGSVAITSAPTRGTVVNNGNGTVTYTPTTNLVGADSFSYTVRDNLNAISNTATVSISVLSVNQPPVANNDTAALASGSGPVTISVLANDTDFDGTINAATVAIVTQSLNGIAVANLNGTITFTPANGFVGSTTFTYSVQDNQGATSTPAAVTVTVIAPITENILITRSEFRVNGATWRVDGTTTARIPGETVQVFNAGTVPANLTSDLLGAATVDVNGIWAFQARGSSIPPNNLRRISLRTSLGAVVNNITLVVR